MSVSLGSVIYSSVKPIIKIYLIIGVGYLCSKLDIVSAESIKSISNIVLTILLPCLSFNKIVSSIEDKDIKDVGIICLSAVLIFGTGLFFAYVCSKLLPMPKEWRGGILAGGMFPNISDLPIAYLQTLDQGLIFTEEEGEKGIASVIIFLAMFLFCVFNLGGFRLIEYDFTYNDEESAVHDTTDNETTPDIKKGSTSGYKERQAGSASSITSSSKTKSLHSFKSKDRKFAFKTFMKRKNKSSSIDSVSQASSESYSNSSMSSIASGSNSRFTVVSPIPIPEEKEEQRFNENENINLQIKRGIQFDTLHNRDDISSIDSYEAYYKHDGTHNNEMKNEPSSADNQKESIKKEDQHIRSPHSVDEDPQLNQQLTVVSTALSPTQSWGGFSTRTSIASEEALADNDAYRMESQPIAFTSNPTDTDHDYHSRRNSESVRSMNELIRSYSNVDQYGNYIERRQSIADSMADSVHSMSSFQKFKNADLTKMLTTDVNITGKDVKESGSFLPDRIQKLPFISLLVFFLKNCLRPASIAVILALICAFIPWVKALFVTTATTPYIPNAPDAEPPLSFIIDFTGYVGAASVPFGLLLLGATLGRLSIGELYPGFWKTASVLVILRQCVMPIFGVLWCDRLVKAGWVNWEDDKMLLFVIAISWALPTMTTLIYFTASYTPPDTEKPIQMECVSFFLMIQYPLLVVSLPFLVTYFLKVQIKV